MSQDHQTGAVSGLLHATTCKGEWNRTDTKSGIHNQLRSPKKANHPQRVALVDHTDHAPTDPERGRLVRVALAPTRHFIWDPWEDPCRL